MCTFCIAASERFAGATGALSLIPLPESVAGDVGYLHLADGARVAVAGDALDEGERLARHGARMNHWGLEYYESPLIDWTAE